MACKARLCDPCRVLALGYSQRVIRLRAVTEDTAKMILSDAERLSVMVTPRILSDVSRTIPGSNDGTTNWRLLLGLMKMMISFDVVRLIAGLFILVHISILFTSDVDRKSTVYSPVLPGVVGELDQVVSSYTALRSPALTTYEAGPMRDGDGLQCCSGFSVACFVWNIQLGQRF